MDRRTFIQGTTTAALTVSALPQLASASSGEFAVGGIPEHVVARIFEEFGDGGFTCLISDSWQTAELGVFAFRQTLRDGVSVNLGFGLTWPIFDRAFDPRYEKVSLAVLAERMAEASPEDPTIAVWENPFERKIGLIRYDLREHVSYATTAEVMRDDLDPGMRAELDERLRQIQAAWQTRLAQRNAEAEQLSHENPWEMPQPPLSPPRGLRFSPGQELGRDDLKVYLVDEAGVPVDAAEITYSIRQIDGDTGALGSEPSDGLIGPAKRPPVHPSVGEYYAALHVPNTALQGTYCIRWTVARDSGASHEIAQLFSVVGAR